MVIREFQYTPEDVDCRYCVKFIHNRCRAVKCPWMNERIEAGVVSYQTAVDESFMDHAILRLRIKIVLGFYDSGKTKITSVDSRLHRQSSATPDAETQMPTMRRCFF